MTTETEIIDQPAPAGDPLAALEAQAAALESAAAPAALPGAAPAMSTADELIAFMQMGRMIAAPAVTWWPQFAAVWSDHQLRQIADSAAAIMEQHGWNMGEVASKYGPYIAMLCAIIPPCVATYFAFKQRQMELAAEERKRRA